MPDTGGTTGRRAHGWWLVLDRGEHGSRCPGCRRCLGGPDYTPPAPADPTPRRRHRR